jgi:hypothetical protein
VTGLVTVMSPPMSYTLITAAQSPPGEETHDMEITDTQPADRPTRWRTRVRRAAGLATLLGGIVLLASACGSSGLGAARTGSGKAAPSGPSAVAYAACIRSHGVPDFPDPQSAGAGSSGSAGDSGSFDPGSPQFQGAQQACKKLAPRGGVSTGSRGALSSADQAKLLRFAQCMRSHGITNFPDPTSMGLSPPDGIDRQSSQFQSAQQACASLLPGQGQGQTQIVTPGGGA